MPEKNNIKALREEKFLSQKELVDKVNIPGFDVPLLSKIENGWCRPTPDIEEAISCHLQATHDELFGQWREITGLWGVGPRVAEYEKIPEADWQCKELVSLLGKGHKKAKGRKRLSAEMDITDRELRKVVARAQTFGFLIGNFEDGAGYFLIGNVTEGLHYYRQEKYRRDAIESRLKPLRKWLIKEGARI